MLAITISMGLLYGVASMMTFNARTTKSTELSGDFNALVSTIQTIINNESSCKTVFSGKNFTASVVGKIDPGISLSSLDLNGSNIAKAGFPETGLKITKIEFDKIETVLPDVTVAGVLNKQYMINLHLEAQKIITGEVSAVGGSQKSANFKLQIIVDPGSDTIPPVITGCYAQNSAAVLESVNKACEALGGVYNSASSPKCSIPLSPEQMEFICTSINGGSWDLVKKKCLMPSVDCIGSFSDCTASCGGGTHIFYISQNESNGGKSCDYATGYVERCNAQACTPNVDCVGDFGPCSETCGGGTQTYKITTPASGTGKSCPYADAATQGCHDQTCTGTSSFTNGGDFKFKVPNKITSLTVELMGAGGIGGFAERTADSWTNHGPARKAYGGGGGCSGVLITETLTVIPKSTILGHVAYKTTSATTPSQASSFGTLIAAGGGKGGNATQSAPGAGCISPGKNPGMDGFTKDGELVNSTLGGVGYLGGAIGGGARGGNTYLCDWSSFLINTDPLQYLCYGLPESYGGMVKVSW